jgi:D-glycero-D-manno-heptose 1,7-bisphosphate phosphatase
MSMIKNNRPAVFLDRDGVINEERGHVHRVEDFHFLPGVPEALRRLQELDLALVVVTNQAGIAKGYYDPQAYRTLTEHMQRELRDAGVKLAGVYCCPHHPTAGIGAWRVDCDCRKPRPGMLRTAARELGLDLAASFIVGDKASDVEAGRAAGLRGGCVLVESGHMLSAACRRSADACVPGLPQAAAWIAARRSGVRPAA